MASSPPRGFRGRWVTGVEARALAGRISGPFTGSPIAWAEPVDESDLQRLVEFASTSGAPLIPRGAGTAMPGGNLGPGIVVSLADAPGWRALGPVADGRIHVGAGVVASDVEKVANTHGLTLPPLPSSARWATVGGMTATNAAGARSFGHGAIARWMESVEGVTPAGDRVRLGPSDSLSSAGIRLDSPTLLPAGWPNVRKNSSGYGLDRWLDTGNPAQLVVGSEGTLLLVTSVTLRLAPVPAYRGVALIAVGSAAEATGLALSAAELGATACEFLGKELLVMTELVRDTELGHLAKDAFALFLLEFEGDTKTQVDDALDRALVAAREIGADGIRATEPDRIEHLWRLRHRASPMIAARAREGLVSTQFVEDSVVPPRHLGAYLEGVERILREEGEEMEAVVFGHAGDGNVHVNPLVPIRDHAWRGRVRAVLDGVVKLAAELGGTLAGEHGDGRIRAPFLDRIWSAEAVTAFRTVRESFDPKGILNPGVILALPGQDPLDGLEPGPRSWPG